MSLIFNAKLRESIAAKLENFTHWSPPQATLKQAAVTITIVPHEGEAGFLLTRRAPRLNAHAGQWALPGGRIDDGETITQAALRELREEISLAAQASDVLGLLDPYPTRSGYCITPVIVWQETLDGMVPNPGEVASIHSFPLSVLDREDSPIFLTIPESEKPVIRLRLTDDAHVHAPTAALLYQFAELVLRGRETRVHELEQPVWAWK
ncbi:MAG: CoA pyrophosphatase [Pseudomonadota bacterium]